MRTITGTLVLTLAAWAAPNGGTALVDAAKNRDQAGVRAALNQKADVNAAEADGTTALHWAAHNNDAQMAALLLKAGANSVAMNRYGVTPLAEAAAAGSAGLIEALLNASADPNTFTTPEGETVLMTASRTGNADAVKLLLDKGANPNARENFKGQTALMWAAAEGHVEVLKALLAKGADVSIRSADRDTTAPKLPAGSPIAPIARGGLTALLFAARQGELEAAKTLLDAKADINQADSDGNNGLTLAILNSHYDLAQVLIRRGADPNVANKDGRAALFMAVDMRFPDQSPRPSRKETDKTTSLDIVQALLAHKANVNQQLKNPAVIDKFAQDHGDRTLSTGATPFMRASRSADIEVMKMLLEKGADPKLANKDGVNALMLAAGVGWADKIRGTEEQSLEALQLTADLGLDVNAVNDRGETSLHGAARRGADSIIQFLVGKGAKLNAKNKQGFTPLDLANGKGGQNGAVGVPHETTAAILAKLGALEGSGVQDAPPAGALTQKGAN